MIMTPQLKSSEAHAHSGQALPPPHLPPPLPSSGQPQIFDFTRRRKWTDILFSELPAIVLLLLDVNRKILYAEGNVTETLGWEVEDLVNTDVLDIITNDDRDTFTARFRESWDMNEEFFSYIRLIAKSTSTLDQDQDQDLDQDESSREVKVLFEVKGHVFSPIEEDQDRRYFIFSAKPYPSRNMALLNTFLECKIENEQLLQRLSDLRAQYNSQQAQSLSESLSMTASMASSSQSVLSQRNVPFGASTSDFSLSGEMPLDPTYNTIGLVSGRGDDDEGGKKKRLKLAQPINEQYVCVTCGRTDSPEWRKGPMGPKTLCNACGLRWAKRTKRTDEAETSGRGKGNTGSSAIASTSHTRTMPGPSESGSGSGSSKRASQSKPVTNPALSVTPLPRLSGSASSAMSMGRSDDYRQADMFNEAAPMSMSMPMSQTTQPRPPSSQPEQNFIPGHHPHPHQSSEFVSVPVSRAGRPQHDVPMADNSEFTTRTTGAYPQQQQQQQIHPHPEHMMNNFHQQSFGAGQVPYEYVTRPGPDQSSSVYDQYLRWHTHTHTQHPGQ